MQASGTVSMDTGWGDEKMERWRTNVCVCVWFCVMDMDMEVKGGRWRHSEARNETMLTLERCLVRDPQSRQTVVSSAAILSHPLPIAASLARYTCVSVESGGAIDYREP